MPSGLIIIDAKTNEVIVANRRSEEIWRSPISRGPQRYDFLKAFRMDTGEWYSLIDWPSMKAIKTRKRTPFQEARIIRGDGTTGYIQVGAAPILNTEGEVSTIIVTTEDITAQKLAELAVKESEARYRTLSETVPQLVWTDLPNGECDYMSSQWIEYTRIPFEEQKGFQWIDRVHNPDDKERVLAHWMGAVQGLHSYDIEYRIRRQDGVYRWFKTRGTPTRNEAGEITYWIVQSYVRKES